MMETAYRLSGVVYRVGFAAGFAMVAYAVAVASPGTAWDIQDRARRIILILSAILAGVVHLAGFGITPNGLTPPASTIVRTFMSAVNAVISTEMLRLAFRKTSWSRQRHFFVVCLVWLIFIGVPVFVRFMLRQR